ncbi:MAG: 23S rRNA (pseudouridine(1915)-N(3))-methyltransferase RlmH [candidate division KSB1 bacterium]|jgi:23S rRNA (pseudouridine1915-N3)-methyltransferase|nr:23S rRNA (pseudouridine(1915)-N(3))-methyltransferase RlmH [candidate division KSB1 bacterium]
MKIRIIAVGKTREKFIAQAEDEYLKRLKHYANVERVDVKAEKITGHTKEDPVRAAEWKRIADNITRGEFVISLHSEASQMSSVKFASYLSKMMNSGRKSVVFVIGGALGLDKDCLKFSDDRISLSSMTFTHEMVRMILLEQLYRAFTIIKGEKYHK